MKNSIVLLACIALLTACSDGFNAKELASGRDLGSGGDPTPSVTPPTPTVTPPIGQDCGEAILSWTNPTTNTDGSPITEPLARNIISYGLAVGSYSNDITISNPAGTASHTIPDLTMGLTYYFTVRAVNQAGATSDYSNVASKTITACAPTLAPATAATAPEAEINVTESTEALENGTAPTPASETAAEVAPIPVPASAPLPVVENPEITAPTVETAE